ncbi:alpha-glucan family phosphorylase [Rapidithrix thailandica]|uniref:Alpha-glucan family phosphorylase n=1 Tax=Rapidithrix thailandica TaxID=413964 RepID=A0AAW9RQI1_9BACT
MPSFEDFAHPYEYDPKYKKSVAYFSMEYAIHQPLKIYSGGLGFLAGSHMRSAYELNQNVIGIGILWKYGYYDQTRKGDQSMDVLFQEKVYSFLEETKIKFQIQVNNHPCYVTAYYLNPKVFGTVPMFFLSTDLPENDYLAQSISHKLYDSDLAAKVAASILLGVGGAKLLDILDHQTDIYHLNEAHALPAAFYLYEKYRDIEEVKSRMVFTTHTPEEAGNEKNDIRLLNKMGFFCGIPLEEVREVTGLGGDILDYSLVTMRFSKRANGVSKLHAEVSKEMWAHHKGVPNIISITNAQNKKYWAEEELYEAAEKGDQTLLFKRKKLLKSRLFELIADQTGKLFDPNALTIVWARRFAEYKRADLITRDHERFERLLNNSKRPIQIVWAGKPYPMDFNAMSQFNSLVHLSKKYRNCATLVGYELALSRMLKQGADVWLNNPRVPREASGTSGMTACMNGAVNLSTNDGWIPEFARHGVNSFIVPPVDASLPVHDQDQYDLTNLLDLLENEILPVYYEQPEHWFKIMVNSMEDVLPYFDSDRMAYQYYEKLYTYDD